MSIKIERIGDTRDELGEGPLWDPFDKVLYWVDSMGCVIHRLDPASGERRDWPVPGQIGSMALREQGGAVLALENGFHFFDFDKSEATLIADPESDEPRTRFNDGKVDRKGRFIAGTMSREIRDQGLGSLYRLNPDLTVETLETDVIVSNGPCFSPDGGTFYFSDSARRAISAYDYDQDTGAISNKRLFVSTERMQTAPDGATVDADGYVWSALVRSGQIGRFAPDGKPEMVIDMPTPHPSSVMFGGPNLDIIYVTSISRTHGLDASDNPLAGCLYAVHGTGAKGIPEPRFAG